MNEAQTLAHDKIIRARDGFFKGSVKSSMKERVLVIKVEGGGDAFLRHVRSCSKPLKRDNLLLLRFTGLRHRSRLLLGLDADKSGEGLKNAYNLLQIFKLALY